MDYRVLIIAPDDNFRSQLTILLAADGLVVDVEADVDEAVRFLTDKGAEVVLFAALGPDDEDLRRIGRLHDASPRTGIIMLESGGSVDFVMEARRRGVTDDVLIPFELSDLFDKIQAAGERARS